MLGALIAWMCANETTMRTDLIIQDLAEVERLVDAADYDNARDVLQRTSYFVNSETLRARMLDFEALLTLRAKRKGDRPGWIVTHCADRLKEHKTDVRFQAWLAEAQLAAGKQTAALATIKDLVDRDLMPDAFAYVVLAKLSIGPQRKAALATCRERAKAKKVCAI